MPKNQGENDKTPEAKQDEVVAPKVEKHEAPVYTTGSGKVTQEDINPIIRTTPPPPTFQGKVRPARDEPNPIITQGVTIQTQTHKSKTRDPALSQPSKTSYDLKDVNLPDVTVTHSTDSLVRAGKVTDTEGIIEFKKTPDGPVAQKPPKPVRPEEGSQVKRAVAANKFTDASPTPSTKTVTKDSLGVPSGAQLQDPPVDPAIQDAMKARRAEVTGKPIVKGSPGVPIAEKLASENKSTPGVSKTNSSLLLKIAIACAAVAAIAAVIAILAAVSIITMGAAVVPIAATVAAVAGASSAFFAYKSNPATAGPKIGPENKADTGKPDVDEEGPKSPTPSPAGGK